MKMNKILLKFAFLVVGVCTMTACFEDEGNYDYTPLPVFYVDTTGVQTEYTVTQHSTMTLPSHLVYDGNKSELSYAWSIYEASSGQYDNPADTLCTTEDFNGQISVDPGTYVLEFSAIRPDGYKTFMQYELKVEGIVGTGELVLYERNGEVDVDIVKSTRQIGSLTSSTVLRNLYTNMNAQYPLKGTPVALSVASDFVSIFTENDGMRVFGDDMRHMYTFDQMFLTAPSTRKVQGVFTDSGTDAVVNDEQVYVNLLNWSGGMPLYPSPKVLMNGSYKADSHITAGGSGAMLGYDKSMGRFLFATMYGSEFEACTASGMSGHDKDLLAFQSGYNYYVYAYMEDRVSKERSILVIKTGRYENNHVVLNTLNLQSCPEIADAKWFTNNSLSPVLHYATPKNIYRVSFDVATSTVTPDATPSWTAPEGEEITLMHMTTDAGIDVTDSPANKVLFVATWNGSEGKLYYLDVNVTSGVVTATPIEVFTGFGKIYDIKFKRR